MKTLSKISSISIQIDFENIHFESDLIYLREVEAK